MSTVQLVIARRRLLRLAHGGARRAVLMDLPRFLYERRAVLLPLLPQGGRGSLVARSVCEGCDLGY